MQQFVAFLGTKSAFLGTSFLSKQTLVEKLVKIVKSFQFCSYKLQPVINTVSVFGVSRNKKTLLVDSGQDSVVLAQAFESSIFPLERQGESFSDISSLTCARRAVRLASPVSNLTNPCNESELGMRKVQILYIMLSPEREPPKTSTKRSAALRSPTGITPLGIYPVFIAIKGGGRPTRRLPHAKMLLVPISFFLCWVDYALEGSTFSLSKCDFSRLFHTGFCLWSAGSAL